MSNPLKSFTELGDLYGNVLLSESKKTADNDFGFKKAGAQKDDGPEAADGFKKKLDEKKKVASAKKDEKKPAKDEVKESISNMDTKKLSFDELYERAMNEGPDSVASPVSDPAGDVGAPAAPFGDTGVDTGVEDVATDDVAAVEPSELFAQICDLVDQLKSHYGIADEVEDTLEGGDDVTDIEDISKESVETETLPDSKGASLQGKNNKVAAVKVSGKGKADTGKLVSDPDAKPLGDKGKALQGKSNKVAGSGPQSKTNVSAFE